MIQGETEFTAASFEDFTAMKIQIAIFWVVTPYSVVAGYKSFRGRCCLHLQGEDVTVQYHNPKHHDLHFHRREKLKSLPKRFKARTANCEMKRLRNNILADLLIQHF
jgi:hypothetical protein